MAPSHLMYANLPGGSTVVLSYFILSFSARNRSYRVGSKIFILLSSSEMFQWLSINFLYVWTFFTVRRVRIYLITYWHVNLRICMCFSTYTEACQYISIRTKGMYIVHVRSLYDPYVMYGVRRCTWAVRTIRTMSETFKRSNISERASNYRTTGFRIRKKTVGRKTWGICRIITMCTVQSLAWSSNIQRKYYIEATVIFTYTWY